MDRIPTDPRPRPSILRRCALGLLGVFGWKTSLVWPPEPRGVIVVYPHTSNWDFPIGVLFRIGHRLKANWVGKQEMFRWPLRGLFLRIGGIPLNRRKTTGFIDALLAGSAVATGCGSPSPGGAGHTDHWKPATRSLAPTCRSVSATSTMRRRPS
jgi:hypothetical protein